jgi:hypothetical protein
VRRSLIVALAALAVLAIASLAVAATQSGVRFEETISAKRPNANTGLNTLINSDGTKDASGKPRAARNTIVKFPTGFKFDYTVRPVCTKAKLQAQGPAGCPARSKIATGSATSVTGLTAIDPVELDVTAFNKKNGLLLYVKTKPNEPAATLILEGKLRRSTLTTPVPKLPQPTPYGEAILTDFRLNIKAIKSGRKFYATTGACPRSGKWITTYTAKYDDGKGDVVVKDESPCRR